MDWKEEFKTKYSQNEFHTDSDIENYADERNLDYGEVFHHLDKIQTVGTKCEGCKHIGYRFSMHPCNVCIRATFIKDMYEVDNQLN